LEDFAAATGFFLLSFAGFPFLFAIFFAMAFNHFGSTYFIYRNHGRNSFI
jgi:hypothetical protein